jgi:hypothetical protein
MAEKKSPCPPNGIKKIYSRGRVWMRKRFSNPRDLKSYLSILAVIIIVLWWDLHAHPYMRALPL